MGVVVALYEIHWRSLTHTSLFLRFVHTSVDIHLGRPDYPSHDVTDVTPGTPTDSYTYSRSRDYPVVFLLG